MKHRPWLVLGVYSLFLFLPVATAHSHLYLVERGDTLFGIAQRYGLSVTDLAKWNALEDIDRLEVGQVLSLAPAGATTNTLPEPFIEVLLEPKTATQGQTQSLRMVLTPGAELTGITFLGIDQVVTAHDALGDFVSVLPAPVLTETGWGALELHAAGQNGEPVTATVTVLVLDGGFEREEIWLSPSTTRLLDPDIVNRENRLMETVCPAPSALQPWQGPFRYPVETPIPTSQFGTLRSYNGGPYRNFHRGLDLRGDTGTPVVASASGVVVLAEALSVRGNTVIVDHGLGVCSGYMHLDRLTVGRGSIVSQGDQLGYVGETGLVTGPHLHWEVRVNGIPVSPGTWVDPGVFLPGSTGSNRP
jgi:murein DD-endopeptidase MepM/ murein hydrolase activator NlpD